MWHVSLNYLYAKVNGFNLVLNLFQCEISFEYNK